MHCSSWSKLSLQNFFFPNGKWLLYEIVMFIVRLFSLGKKVSFFLFLVFLKSIISFFLFSFT